MAGKFSISDAVRDVLARSTITADRVVLPPGQLDRKLYADVNKALEGAGGKWDRKAKAHLFERDPREALGLVSETGEVVNVKQALQAFYTPDALADRVAALAELEPGMRVLEPSCGEGSLVRAVLRREPKIGSIHGIDIDTSAWSKVCALTQAGSCGDFLQITPAEIGLFDAIVMNPPFTKGQDMAHVLHAWSFLKPGGTLVAITAPSWKYRVQKSAVAFREFVEKHSEHVEDVPEGAFKESGTGTATVLVVLKRPA
jgi:type I restriction-modification system DNA methylase subunit